MHQKIRLFTKKKKKFQYQNGYANYKEMKIECEWSMTAEKPLPHQQCGYTSFTFGNFRSLDVGQSHINLFLLLLSFYAYLSLNVCMPVGAQIYVQHRHSAYLDVYDGSMVIFLAFISNSA